MRRKRRVFYLTRGFGEFAEYRLFFSKPCIEKIPYWTGSRVAEDKVWTTRQPPRKGRRRRRRPPYILLSTDKAMKHLFGNLKLAKGKVVQVYIYTTIKEDKQSG